MTPSRALRFAVLGTALSAGMAGSVRADAPRCAPIVVRADAEVLSLFPELPSRIRDTFADQVGVDTCAQVQLSMNHPAITVDVTLSDGRSASRSVPEREDVMAVLSALLLVPPSESLQPEADQSTEPVGAPATAESP